jgi:hypothetical protein
MTAEGATSSDLNLVQIPKNEGKLGMSPYQISDDGMLRAIYRPLICTIVYGPDVYFECLRWFLESLVEFGAYQGRVVIICDRTIDHLFEYVPSFLADKLVVKSLTALDHSARYDIGEQDIGGHSPVLYVDSDIIVNTNINAVLRAIAAQNGICVTTEELTYPDLCSSQISMVQDVRRIGNWWGLEILRADEDCADKVLPLVNSGIIGFKYYNEFKLVADLVYQLYRHPSHRNLATYFGDQPFLNYVLVKTQLGSYEPLRGACDFVGTLQPFPQVERGFVHFNWAIGADKSRRMKLYLDDLRAQRGA